MEKKTKEELWAEWVATQNIGRFQDLLKHETDEGRYRILEVLLADEFEKFKKSPLP
jgi:hypothetical protein